MWSSWLGRRICLSERVSAVRGAVFSQVVEVRRATGYVYMFGISVLLVGMVSVLM